MWGFLAAPLKGIWERLKAGEPDAWALLLMAVGALLQAVARLARRSRQQPVLARTLLATVLLLGVSIVWYLGWLDWLARAVSIPLWAVGACALLTLVSVVMTTVAAWRRRQARRARSRTPANPFPWRGVLWEWNTEGFITQPLCPRCRMFMKHEEDPRFAISDILDMQDAIGEHTWRCRDCGLPFYWKGTYLSLREELSARWDAERRKLQDAGLGPA